MPTYDYKCDACEHQFELYQSITAEPERKCPECGRRKLRRLIGPGAAIIFKGSGFYKTDYRSEAYQKKASADSSASSSSATSSSSASSSSASSSSASSSSAGSSDGQANGKAAGGKGGKKQKPAGSGNKD